MKDQLFLLQPGFFDGNDGPFYGGDSVPVEGLLGLFPQLRSELDVHRIEAARPRSVLVNLIGEANQSLPVLILGDGTAPKDPSIPLNVSGSTRFINNESDIRTFLSTQYGLPLAR